MPQVTFDVPTNLAQELNQVAQANGFTNAKAMTIAYWRATIKAARGTQAMVGVKEAAEAQADTDTATIT